MIAFIAPYILFLHAIFFTFMGNDTLNPLIFIQNVHFVRLSVQLVDGLAKKASACSAWHYSMREFSW